MRESTHTTKFSGFTGPNYTQVPDALFDDLLPDLSGAELKVLLYIIRRTFGFKRDSDNISLSQMLNGIRTRDGHVLDRGVGLSKKTLLAAINSLEEGGVVLTERRRSTERGDEPTAYRLHVIEAPPGGKTTPPLGEKLPQGGGVETTPGPWGKNSPTQKTVLQETVSQETDDDLSKFRQGKPQDFVFKRARQDDAVPRTLPAVTGFESIGSLLPPQTRSTPTRDTILAPESSKKGSAAGQVVVETTFTQSEPPAVVSAPQDSAAKAAGRRTGDARTPRSAADRALLLAYIRDYAGEFHDQASLKSSVTRAHHLFVQSGLARERWVEQLYEAHRQTRERSAAIGYQGQHATRRTTATGLTNKMPYFFETLTCVLGLHDHPTGQHPLPLTPQEFKQQQGRARRARTQPEQGSSESQHTLTEQHNAPAPRSLAGKYAHLVQRWEESSE